MRIKNYLGHTVVCDLLDGSGIALDCGANHGDFATWLSRNSKLSVHSFEADPRLYQRLPKVDRVQFHHFAVAEKSGSLELGLGESTCSSVIYRESDSQATTTVPAISLDDFCQQQRIEEINFIKMDIEGAELGVLQQTSEQLLRRVKQITVEFHDMQCPAEIPEIKATVRRLEALGFYFIRFSVHTWGDCLFLNKKLVNIGWIDKANLQLFGKLLPGCARVLKKFVRPSL